MKQQEITLAIGAASETPDQAMRNVTREVWRTLSENIDADVRLASGEPVPGQKAEPITMGLIVLALIKSGSAAKIIESLRKAFKHDSSLTATFRDENGKTVEVNAINISRRATEEALDQLISGTTT